jgi:hypothetical protein
MGFLDGGRFAIRRLVRRRSATLYCGDNDQVLFDVEVIENSIIANTPAPSRRLQAFDVATERVNLECVQCESDRDEGGLRALFLRTW